MGKMNQSQEEDAVVKYAEDRPNMFGRKEGGLSVESELPEGMKKPTAEGEDHMGGIRKGADAGGHMGNASMSKAVDQLNYETERGQHAPAVGGHADAGHAHAGIMKKA